MESKQKVILIGNVSGSGLWPRWCGLFYARSRGAAVAKRGQIAISRESWRDRGKCRVCKMQEAANEVASRALRPLIGVAANFRDWVRCGGPDFIRERLKSFSVEGSRLR